MLAMYKERNPLLARDDIGRSKPSTYKLPETAHTYGVKSKKEEFGAGKLTSSWHLPALQKVTVNEKDF